MNSSEDSSDKQEDTESVASEEADSSGTIIEPETNDEKEDADKSLDGEGAQDAENNK